ncbi:MAG: NAD(P)/FAD-dependent oxidoreductase [Clostridiaceae bacterium]
MQTYDLIVIGGGIAGMSSAIEAKKNGVENVIILEKESELGGMLNQCTDSGFGIEIFGENLTAPEFSQRFIDEVTALGIEYKLDTMALELSREKVAAAVNSKEGIFKIRGKVIILASGCIERARYTFNISGSKFAGIYTARVAQQITNTVGLLPGKEVVVIGSGNLGLIMARTITLEGAKVKGIIESLGEVRGNGKYLKECTEDFNIPVLLRHIVTGLQGTDRIESVTISEIDSDGRKIEGTEETIKCDTLILSAELIPNDSLLKKAAVSLNGGITTDIKGIYVCGDANYIHEDPDSIIAEAREAGACAARYILRVTSK